MAILTEEKIKTNLQTLRGWGIVDGQLQKTYSFDGFMKALEFINKLAIIAEQENHHPDMRVKYNKVTIALFTHDEDGITELDFTIAKEAEKLAVTVL